MALRSYFRQQFSARYFVATVIFIQACEPVVSRSCYYDAVAGRTVCRGLPYGARLAIGVAISIVAALALAAVSHHIRRRFSSSQGPPPVSAGYYGPPQTGYPPTAAYGQNNVYSGPAPAQEFYAPPPIYNPSPQQPHPGYQSKPQEAQYAPPPGPPPPAHF